MEQWRKKGADVKVCALHISSIVVGLQVAASPNS